MIDRHLTADERKNLKALMDKCGFAEVLRVVGQYVSNEHPDFEVGNALRRKVCNLAGEIDKAWKALAQP